MTVLEPSALGSARRPARRRLTAAGLAATALAAAGWWATHPGALEPVGSSLAAPVAVGESLVVTMFAHPTSGEVRLERAEPVVTENSADATVTVRLCGNRDARPGATIVGSVVGPAERACATTAPPTEVALHRVGPEHPYLVVEITPRAPGTVTVEGLRVRYRTGLQRGEQDSGLVVTTRTGP